MRAVSCGSRDLNDQDSWGRGRNNTCVLYAVASLAHPSVTRLECDHRSEGAARAAEKCIFFKLM